MRRLERWIFAPGDPRRLAALRIGLCSILAVRLSRGLYTGLAAQPAELFRPISFMRLFPSMPPRTAVFVVQGIGVAAALCAAVGLRARLTLPLAWVCGLLLNGMATSVGKVVHNDVMLLLAMVPLLPAAAADAWALDARTARPGASVRYGWPVRTAMIVVAGGYFFSGLAKLVFSGPSWAFGDNLRWVMYAASDAQRVPNALGLFIADHPIVAHLAALFTLVVELGFPVVLLRPRAVRFFLPAAIALHASIWATMHLDYSAWALTALVVFVDWGAVADRVRTHHTLRAVDRRSAALG